MNNFRALVLADIVKQSQAYGYNPYDTAVRWAIAADTFALFN